METRVKPSNLFNVYGPFPACEHVNLPDVPVLKPGVLAVPGEQHGRVQHGAHGGGEPGAGRPGRGGPHGGPGAGGPQGPHRGPPAAGHLLQRRHGDTR